MGVAPVQFNIKYLPYFNPNPPSEWALACWQDAGTSSNDKPSEGPSSESRVAQLSLLSQYRERAKQADRLYKEAKGVIDVSRSKAELALHREAYLIDQVRRVADSFKCEHPSQISNASFHAIIQMTFFVWQLFSLTLWWSRGAYPPYYLLNDIRLVALNLPSGLIETGAMCLRFFRFVLNS